MAEITNDRYKVHREFNIGDLVRKLHPLVQSYADIPPFPYEYQILLALEFIADPAGYNDTFTVPSRETDWLYHLVNSLLSVYENTTINIIPGLKAIRVDEFIGKLAIDLPVLYGDSEGTNPIVTGEKQ